MTRGPAGHSTPHTGTHARAEARWTPAELTVRHCWIVRNNRRDPALLLRWERVEGRWMGEVVYAVPGGHTVMWVPSAMLRSL